MNYKSAYNKLKRVSEQSGALVCDFDGPGYILKPNGYCILINYGLNYKEKFFVLSHELGHITKAIKSPKRTTLTIGNIPSNVPLIQYYSEGYANKTALKIMKEFGIVGIRKDYYRFYKKCKRWWSGVKKN